MQSILSLMTTASAALAVFFFLLLFGFAVAAAVGLATVAGSVVYAACCVFDAVTEDGTEAE